MGYFMALKNPVPQTFWFAEFRTFFCLMAIFIRRLRPSKEGWREPSLPTLAATTQVVTT